MRGRQTIRLLKLARLLQRPGGLSADEAASELGCVRRTFYRDLQALEELCYPVYSESDGAVQRYHVRADFRVQHQLPITHEELTALWVARAALGALEGTVFGDGARSLLDKLHDALTEDVRRRAERAQETLALTPPGRRYGDRAPVVDTLRRCAEELRSVDLTYTPLTGRLLRRRVDPYLLRFDPRTESLYLVAYDHARSALRTFLVDRVSEAHATDENFILRSERRPRQHLAGSFAAFEGAATPVRLSFSGRAARLVSERTWHETQTIESAPDGRVDLAMHVPLSPGLTSWVLSWMPEVAVLAPASLARDVRAALQAGLLGAMGGKRRLARAGRLDGVAGLSKEPREPSTRARAGRSRR